MRRFFSAIFGGTTAAKTKRTGIQASNAREKRPLSGGHSYRQTRVLWNNRCLYTTKLTGKWEFLTHIQVLATLSLPFPVGSFPVALPTALLPVRETGTFPPLVGASSARRPASLAGTASNFDARLALAAYLPPQ